MSCKVSNNELEIAVGVIMDNGLEYDTHLQFRQKKLDDASDFFNYTFISTHFLVNWVHRDKKMNYP